MNNPTIVDPASLTTNLSAHKGASGAATYAVWYGLRQNCPCNQIDLPFFNFPMHNTLRVDNPKEIGAKVPVPVFGALNLNVTVEMFLALKEALPRVILRFVEQRQVQREEHGTGVNTGSAHSRPPRGYPVTIKTDKQIEEIIESSGRAPKPYRREPNDRPVADYLYWQVCPDQENPQRGLVLPPPISETGLVWPDPIDPALELMA